MDEIAAVHWKQYSINW